jgi:rare lipoprotein A
MHTKQVIQQSIKYAGWYGKNHHGKKTASGEIYDMYKLTAAHKTLPFGTKVKVTNLDNNQSIIVVINDRGPFIKGRVVDLSKSAALKIGIKGIQKVSMQIVF